VFDGCGAADAARSFNGFALSCELFTPASQLPFKFGVFVAANGSASGGS
jgi:hypothetical protein